MSRLMHLDFTVGALQTAIGVSGFLLGCSTTQTYAYYKNYPHDSRTTKYYVALLWILEAAQQIAAMHAVYTMSVTNWGNLRALLHQPSSISATFYLGICVPPLVESFYLWRLYRLFGKSWPCLVGVGFSWIRFSGWLLFAVQETRLGYVSGELAEKWTWLLIALLVTGASLNGCIAAAMLYYLHGQRNTPMMRTKILVDRLMMWTLQTGLLTGITYIIVLIVFLTMQDTLVWMAILACTTKIFSNCLLSSCVGRNRRNSKLLTYLSVSMLARRKYLAIYFRALAPGMIPRSPNIRLLLSILLGSNPHFAADQTPQYNQSAYTTHHLLSCIRGSHLWSLPRGIS